MDDDPLTYFLTPAPDVNGDDGDMEMDFGFDAGIGRMNNAAEIVRSVSPSSLDGMSLPPPRPPTPPKSPPAGLSSDPESATDEEDDEEYVRFGIGRHHTIGLPFSLRDFASAKMKKASRGKATVKDLLSPSSTLPSHGPTAAARGRSTSRPGPSPLVPRYGGTRGRTRSLSARPSPHAWREPSPDVWSIEEETEEDMGSELGSNLASDREEATTRLDKTLERSAAKPKKRVRFVLPIKGDY